VKNRLRAGTSPWTTMPFSGSSGTCRGLGASCSEFFWPNRSFGRTSFVSSISGKNTRNLADVLIDLESDDILRLTYLIQASDASLPASKLKTVADDANSRLATLASAYAAVANRSLETLEVVTQANGAKTDAADAAADKGDGSGVGTRARSGLRCLLDALEGRPEGNGRKTTGMGFDSSDLSRRPLTRESSREEHRPRETPPKPK
jgi:hypothetical protein